MKKVVILGCENSHANSMLKHMENHEDLSDIEVIGVYSDEPAAAQSYHEKFGIPVMASYDEAVGKVDGVIVTARHGKNHYPYAKPYIDSGVPMFIDKPITICPEEAVEFMRALKENGVQVSGGSILRHCAAIQSLKQAEEAQEGGRTAGGIFRAPIDNVNEYGNFYFYSQHLVEMVLESFGQKVNAVQVSTDAQKNHTVLFHYDNFTVTGLFTEGSNQYYGARFAITGSQGGAIALGNCSELCFREYVDLLRGGKMTRSYDAFIAPVFVLNAIDRAIASGKVEPVNYVAV